MLRTFFLLIPAFVLAADLADLVRLADKSLAIRAAQEQRDAARSLFEAQRSQNLPRLDLAYQGIYFKEKPVMFFGSSLGTETIQTGPMNSYSGHLRLSYPLFTGFALSSLTDEKRIAWIQSELAIEDAKRNLYLGVVRLFCGIHTAREASHAAKKAHAAAEESLNKARGFYEKGMLPISEVLNLEARVYEAKAALLRTKNREKILKNELGALLGQPVNETGSLPHVGEYDATALIKQASQQRPDLQILKEETKKAQERITQARSGLYPRLTLVVQEQRIGDDPSIDGDGFTNKDKSYAGFMLEYNLFGGGETIRGIEAARHQFLAARHLYDDYANRVRALLENADAQIISLAAEKEAAQKELEFRRGYCDLTRGRFENQLASADELGRAIADLAISEAKVQEISAMLYEAYAVLLLEVSPGAFLDSLGIDAAEATKGKP